MAPKKRLKSGVGTAKAFASGDKSLATASDVGSVCPLMLACNACIDSMYSLRHKTDADIPTEGLKQLPLDGSGKQYVWPVQEGGTFKDIAQRAWKSPEHLIAESCEMLVAAGILDPDATPDEWPPKAGASFDTSVLMWSFQNESFWRGKHVAMSEIIGTARAISLTRFREGEMISLRLPPTSELVDASCDNQNIAQGTLWFGDGSQKTLAGFTVWIAMLICWKNHREFIGDPQVVQLLSSLLVIPTVLKATDSATTNSLQSVIGKIVKQNSDSRVQPVSSLQWASILMAMKDEHGGKLGYDAAMDAYNQHPEVRAVSDNTAESGAGSIALDRRRKLAVKNWLEKTCEKAFAIVEASTHDLAFALGPFGETIASYQFLFLGSTASGLAANPACELRPLDHEAFIPIDYKLPMNDLGQTMLFKRIQSNFDRETSMVGAAHKKKYRMKEENLINLRNLSCLFAQLVPHLETRLPPPDMQKWVKEFSESAQRDEDIKFILDAQPANFSLSMLPSSCAVAQKQAQQREQAICLAVEKQRLDVLDAQWTFFKSGLMRDQCLIEKIKEVPRKVATKLHQKQVKHMQEQAKAGEAAVSGYSEKYLKVVHVARAELTNAEISEMRDAVAKDAGCTGDEITFVSLCDFNVPNCRASSSIDALTERIASVNNVAPEKNVGLAIFPDLPKDSSLRGLYDEEKTLQEAFFALKQHCDTRFIELYDRDKRSVQKSNSRRFGSGRIVVSHDKLDSNPWLSTSDLAISGRPVRENESESGAPTIKLPKGQELLLPEAGSPDQDLRMSERLKPSPEQAAAQKGIRRAETLLISLFKGMKLRGPTLLINFTGYVEEFGVAVFNLRQQGVVEDVDFKRIYYLSTHFLDSPETAEYGKTRIVRELLDAWCDKRMVYAGIKFTDSDVKLSEEELSQIPGSEVVKSVDALKLEVTVRNGSSIDIHPDQVKLWKTQGGNYADEFEKLVQNHDKTYKTMLAGIINTGGGSGSGSQPMPVAGQDEEGEQPEVVVPAPSTTEFESVDALKAKDEIQFKAVSEISDVELLRGKSGSTYLVAVKKNRDLPRYTIIGGFGTGKFIPVAAPEEGLLLEWPDSDKTMIQVDHGSINPESTNTEVMSIYRYMVLLERQKKITKYELSYSEVTRLSGGDTDGFSVKISQGHKFKTMNDSSKAASCKTWFGDSISAVEASPTVSKVFRVRFDRVNQCSKLQKPYVMLKHALTLQLGRPVKVC
eukprot:s564_g5.t1